VKFTSFGNISYYKVVFEGIKATTAACLTALYLERHRWASTRKNMG